MNFVARPLQACTERYALLTREIPGRYHLMVTGQVYPGDKMVGSLCVQARKAGERP
jgi:hypothetical protein